MYRLYSPPRNISGDKIIIEDKYQIHHLKDVLRIKTEDEVIVFDGCGKEYGCKIKSITGSGIELDKCRELSSKNVRGLKLSVACAIPKNSKMDDIIDKLTQLGVDRIIPLETRRVIVELDEKKKASRLERWRKIAFNATLQSQGGVFPVIEPVKEFKDMISELGDFDLKLIPTLAAKSKGLKDALGRSRPKNILVLIGPEGDFTPEEVRSALIRGFIPVSLGDRVLRVETAAVSIAAFIRLSLTN